MSNGQTHLDHCHVEVDNVVIQPVEAFQGLEVLARYADPANCGTLLLGWNFIVGVEFYCWAGILLLC